MCLRALDRESTMRTQRSRATSRWMLHTGDIATIDGEGYIRLVDRTKTSSERGEWISSVDSKTR